MYLPGEYKRTGTMTRDKRRCPVQRVEAYALLTNTKGVRIWRFAGRLQEEQNERGVVLFSSNRELKRCPFYYGYWEFQSS
jgi:hypothetical protein